MAAHVDDTLVIVLAGGAGERLYPLTKERADSGRREGREGGLQRTTRHGMQGRSRMEALKLLDDLRCGVMYPTLQQGGHRAPGLPS